MTERSDLLLRVERDEEFVLDDQYLQFVLFHIHS
jgi:hypothetical protein